MKHCINRNHLHTCAIKSVENETSMLVQIERMAPGNQLNRIRKYLRDQFNMMMGIKLTH